MTSTISLKPSKDNLIKHDGPAGLVVFLVALPLCLGIALASGAPLFSGILAGIVGGVVISILSGSHVSVAGPAAGLAVIVATAIQELKFEPFLMSVVIAGFIQMAFGVLRLGTIANYVPNAVIRGMLASIGLVLVLKQIPHALGRDQDYDGDLTFLESQGSNTFTDIITGVLSAHPGAVILSIICLAVLVVWDGKAAGGIRWMQLVPGALIVVLLGVGINQFFGLFFPNLFISNPMHMVSMPTPDSFSGFFSALSTPDFSVAFHKEIWMTGFTIAVIASLESLLSLEAADRLDPYRRISPTNRELFAQGTGNMLSGLIGGLPVTSVVVRTTANVYAGSRTWLSSFVHGVLLLGSTLLIPKLLNLIPLACLAILLIVVGYKLTKPQIFMQMYKRGWDQFLPFVVTVTAVLFTDLLKGVLVGLVCGLFFVIRKNHHAAITVVRLDKHYLMRFNKDASFVNKSEFRNKLRELPDGSHVILDGTKALFIDHDIQEVAEDFRKMAPYKDITFEVKNF